jgi:cytochrome c553
MDHSQFRTHLIHVFPPGAFLLTLTAMVLVARAEAPAGAAKIEFNRDIRPILSDACFHCHGPDKNTRESGLRLDVREEALKEGDLGERAIVPGKPEESDLVRRIFAEDEDEQMPPPEAHKVLSAAQKETLKQWIAQGAEYQIHWAYLPIERPAVPAPGSHPVDAFIRQRLTQEGLQAAAEADKVTLIRRLTLDLIGLPPTPAEVDAFVNDAAPGAYERVVDRLLASPHFGERMAVDWLDAARYADTNGYQVDRDRTLYAWRDWVIRAFNENKRFDEFTIEQIAGDLLPDATPEQRIATGFNRNHMINEEGGVTPEEFLANYTADRVETTATVWLAQTLNCTRCHDHKFDPLTQRDFYSLKAFFHNVSEKGVGDYAKPANLSSPPFLTLPAPDIEAKIAALKAEIEAVTPDPGPAAKDRLPALKKSLAEVEKTVPVSLVMDDATPRETFILLRGEFDQIGEKVTAATPAVMPPMRADLPRNRLGLAQWLVDPANPLPARVTVNRYWQMLFGTGLVSTAEDFGSQGEPPSHPELIDWLAAEFISSGWDTKAMLRLLVTSATYRQSSKLTPAARERDPDNRLLARGPRFRLHGEFVRDQALAASGLLVRKIGGPSVKPYHPPGLYEQVVNTRDNPKSTYTQDKGEALHRRSIYTYWKRSVPNPAMLLFDAPFRESCVLRRPRTNTPLQALNLLNDPTYVEASRRLAQRMMLEGGASVESRLGHGFRLVTARLPRPAEMKILKASLERTLGDFQADLAGAGAFLKVGEAATDGSLNVAELAAYATVASTMLNLDEAVTKE